MRAGMGMAETGEGRMAKGSFRMGDKPGAIPAIL